MPPAGLKFSVSAPGKVILFGEHSVVYGKPAIAASINKRTTLIFESKNTDVLELDFAMLNLSLSVPLNEVQKILQKFSLENSNSTNQNYQIPFNEHLIDNVDNFQLLERSQQVSVFCFFYLLFRLSSTSEVPIKGFKIAISSELTVGAGTGSSASFAVCLAAALYHYFGILQNNGEGDANKRLFTAQDKKIINEYAFACEQIIHGLASGIDNFVCTYGSIVKMVSEDDEKNNNKVFKVLENVGTLRIFLVNSGVSRSTAKMVHVVRDLHSRNPLVVDALLHSMGLVATTACSVLAELKSFEKNKFDEIYAAEFNKLEDLVSINHGLLATLGVSHDSLDSIVHVTKKHDIHSKMTGAGGGGFAFTLIPPYKSNDSVLDCKYELEENGFTVDDIIIGGTGVDISIHS